MNLCSTAPAAAHVPEIAKGGNFGEKKNVKK